MLAQGLAAWGLGLGLGGTAAELALLALAVLDGRTLVGLVSLASARPPIIDLKSQNVLIFCQKVA